MAELEGYKVVRDLPPIRWRQLREVESGKGKQRLEMSTPRAGEEGGDAAAWLIESARLQEGLAKKSKLWVPVQEVGTFEGVPAVISPLPARTVQWALGRAVRMPSRQMYYLVRSVLQGLDVLHAEHARGHGSIGPAEIALPSKGQGIEVQLRFPLANAELPGDAIAGDLRQLGELILRLATPMAREFESEAALEALQKQMGKSGAQWDEFCRGLLAAGKEGQPGSAKEALKLIRPMKPASTGWIKVAAPALVVVIGLGAMHARHVGRPGLRTWKEDPAGWTWDQVFPDKLFVRQQEFKKELDEIRKLADAARLPPTAPQSVAVLVKQVGGAKDLRELLQIRVKLGELALPQQYTALITGCDAADELVKKTRSEAGGQQVAWLDSAANDVGAVRRAAVEERVVLLDAGKVVAQRAAQLGIEASDRAASLAGEAFAAQTSDEANATSKQAAATMGGVIELLKVFGDRAGDFPELTSKALAAQKQTNRLDDVATAWKLLATVRAMLPAAGTARPTTVEQAKAVLAEKIKMRDAVKEASKPAFEREELKGAYVLSEFAKVHDAADAVVKSAEDDVKVASTIGEFQAALAVAQGQISAKGVADAYVAANKALAALPEEYRKAQSLAEAVANRDALIAGATKLEGLSGDGKIAASVEKDVVDADTLELAKDKQKAAEDALARIAAAADQLKAANLPENAAVMVAMQTLRKDAGNAVASSAASVKKREAAELAARGWRQAMDDLLKAEGKWSNTSAQDAAAAVITKAKKDPVPDDPVAAKDVLQTKLDGLKKIDEWERAGNAPAWAAAAQAKDAVGAAKEKLRGAWVDAYIKTYSPNDLAGPPQEAQKAFDAICTQMQKLFADANAVQTQLDKVATADDLKAAVAAAGDLLRQWVEPQAVPAPLAATVLKPIHDRMERVSAIQGKATRRDAIQAATDAMKQDGNWAGYRAAALATAKPTSDDLDAESAFVSANPPADAKARWLDYLKLAGADGARIASVVQKMPAFGWDPKDVASITPDAQRFNVLVCLAKPAKDQMAYGALLKAFNGAAFLTAKNAPQITRLATGKGGAPKSGPSTKGWTEDQNPPAGTVVFRKANGTKLPVTFVKLKVGNKDMCLAQTAAPLWLVQEIAPERLSRRDQTGPMVWARSDDDTVKTSNPIGQHLWFVSDPKDAAVAVNGQTLLQFLEGPDPGWAMQKDDERRLPAQWIGAKAADDAARTVGCRLPSLEVYQAAAGATPVLSNYHVRREANWQQISKWWTQPGGRFFLNHCYGAVGPWAGAAIADNVQTPYWFLPVDAGPPGPAGRAVGQDANGFWHLLGNVAEFVRLDETDTPKYGVYGISCLSPAAPSVPLEVGAMQPYADVGFRLCFEGGESEEERLKSVIEQLEYQP